MKKILSQDEAIFQCREWKRNGRRIVFVSGCFALLHPGHIRLLEQARSYGDILIAALTSDPADSRSGVLPSFIPFVERSEILSALAAVDFVTDFDSARPAALIAKLCPDVIVTGAETLDTSQTESSMRRGKATASAQSIGPEIVRLPLEPGYSTKLLLDRIAQLPS